MPKLQGSAGVDETREENESEFGYHCENCGTYLNDEKDEEQIQSDGTVLCKRCAGLSETERKKFQHPELYPEEEASVGDAG